MIITTVPNAQERNVLDIPSSFWVRWRYQIRTKRVGRGRLVTVQAIG
jgi:hypothetical protein